MAFLDAVKSILSGVPSAIEHIPSEVETGARGIGSVLADARAPGVPGYAVDPLSGQMQQTQSPPTRVNFWKNMLSGALTGLAASHPGENFGQAVGGGFHAAQQQGERRDLIARQEAQQQFADQSEAQRLQIERQQAATTEKLSQARLAQMGLQNKVDALNLSRGKALLPLELRQALQKIETGMQGEGYINAGTLKVGEPLDDLIKANPDLAKDLAMGYVHSIPSFADDGSINGATVYLRSHAYRDPNAPSKEAVSVPQVQNGQLKWIDIAPGSITNRQADLYRQAGVGALLNQAKARAEQALADERYTLAQNPKETRLQALQALSERGLAELGALRQSPKYMGATASQRKAMEAANQAKYDQQAAKYGGWGVLHAAQGPTQVAPPNAGQQGQSPTLPPGAVAGRKDGKIVGYMLGGQWHSLQ